VFNGFRLGEPLLDLLIKTGKEVIDDDCASIAAQLAYYFALALFPALLFVVALASYLPFPVINDVINAIAPLAPPDVLSIIRGQLESIVSGEQTSLLTVGILGAIWSSSGAMTSIVSSLNKAYDIPESRRGFGFITPDGGGTDVFVHVSAVERAGLTQLVEGQRVNFQTLPDTKGKGPKAVNLKVLE
jgi:cold shock CspA family protein